MAKNRPDHDANGSRHDTDGSRWLETNSGRPDNLIGLLSACISLNVVNLEMIVAVYKPPNDWKESNDTK